MPPQSFLMDNVKLLDLLMKGDDIDAKVAVADDDCVADREVRCIAFRRRGGAAVCKRDALWFSFQELGQEGH